MSEEVLTQENNQPLIKYVPTDAAIMTLKQQYGTLKADTEYEEVRQAIATVRTLRTGIEKRRVELKADALEWGRKVDKEAKRLTGMLLEIEEPLKLEKAKVDDEKERIAREKIEAEERARQEADQKAREAEEARLRAIREAEDARIREEQAKLEAERKRLFDETAAFRKQQAEEQAQRKAEQDRIWAEQRAERNRLDMQRKVMEEEQRKIRVEQERIDRLEFERVAKEKAEQQAKEKATRDMKEAEVRRIEEIRKAEEERQAQLIARPDVEKIHAFAKVLSGLSFPVVKNQRAKEFVLMLCDEVFHLAELCEKFTINTKGKK